MLIDKINKKQIYLLILLSLFLLSCSECEEVPYIDLDPTYRCPNYYTFTDLKTPVIDIISSDEDIDKYANKSISYYVAFQSEKSSDTIYTKQLQDESNRNRMLTELTECIRKFHVDFSKYSIAAIATPNIVDASTSTEKVCSDEINVYIIMANPVSLYEHSYDAYLLVPKGDYKLNVKKVRPPTGPY